MALVKHSEIESESEGDQLNLKQLRNRKIFVTSESHSGGLLIFIFINFQLSFCFSVKWGKNGNSIWFVPHLATRNDGNGKPPAFEIRPSNAVGMKNRLGMRPDRFEIIMEWNPGGFAI